MRNFILFAVAGLGLLFAAVPASAQSYVTDECGNVVLVNRFASVATTSRIFAVPTNNVFIANRFNSFGGSNVVAVNSGRFNNSVVAVNRGGSNVNIVNTQTRFGLFGRVRSQNTQVVQSGNGGANIANVNVGRRR